MPTDEQRRGVEAGAAAAALAQPEPVGDQVPLGGALALVAAGEVQHLGEVVGHGQHDLERRRRRSGPGPVLVSVQRPRSAPPGDDLELDGQPSSPAAVVGGGQPEPVARRTARRASTEARGPGRAGGDRPAAASTRWPRRCGRVNRPWACSPSSGIPGPVGSRGVAPARSRPADAARSRAPRQGVAGASSSRSSAVRRAAARGRASASPGRRAGGRVRRTGCQRRGPVTGRRAAGRVSP